MIILMGLLGSGKSVQGGLLAKNTGYQWLSTGEYIRANAVGELREKMLKGELLNDQELFKIMGEYIDGLDGQTDVILDGFPRTIGQADWLYQQHAKGKINIQSIVFLEVSKDIAKKRLLTRGRPDDKEDIIERRFDEYESQTLPVIDWLKNKGINLFTINGEHEEDEVQVDILKKLDLVSK